MKTMWLVTYNDNSGGFGWPEAIFTTESAARAYAEKYPAGKGGDSEGMSVFVDERPLDPE